jgi:gliding motility-associated lipoprotein GldH
MSKDTVECQLADETGKWLGEGSGDIWDNQILFKKRTRFPLPGKYTFSYQHAMWLENMPCVMEIGMRIEKAKQ